MPQPLSSKDAASFRQLVKLYEAKQHKKALKTAEQVLKKNPNHGDTLAMKVRIYCFRIGNVKHSPCNTYLLRVGSHLERTGAYGRG
jgi:hypothetical protein